MGIINPIIVVPESIQTYGGEKELAYAHEFIHIKHWDTLFKAICFVVIALHWYNPLVYYLWKELETTSKMVCDETMAVNMEKEKRVQYGNMIIDMAEAAGCQKDSFMISFSKGKGMIEERIVRLLQVKRQRGISKFLSMFLGLGPNLPRWSTAGRANICPPTPKSWSLPSPMGYNLWSWPLPKSRRTRNWSAKNCGWASRMLRDAGSRNPPGSCLRLRVIP